MPENEFGFENDDAFGIQGDETVVEQGSYKTFENGEYKVNGIFAYMKKDGETPIFVPQGDNMVARFKLRMLETRATENTSVQVEVEGPPMSATYNQMILLVRAFGGDITKLPSEPTSKFLMDAQELANRGGKVRTASIKKGNGWVNFLEGMTPPAEGYTWELLGFRSHDGTTPVAFKEKTQSNERGSYTEDFAYADFVVVGNTYGLETPYKGYRLSVKVKNPFDGGVATNKSGKSIPTTSIGQSGGIPVDVKRWVSLRDAFFSDFRHEWVSDPEKSSFGTDELANPLVVVDAHVRKNPKRAIAKLAYNKYGFPSVDVNDFIPALNQNPQPAAAPQPSELEAFYDYVTKKYGKDIFSPTDKNADEINLSLTTKGKTWAKETLVPLWDKLALPVASDGMRYIAKLEPKQLVDLTNELRKLNGEDALNEALIGDGAF